MKNSLLFVLLLALAINTYGQEFSSDFKTIAVNKKIKEFPDRFDLSSPLNSFITLNYIYINGKDRLLKTIYTIKYKSTLPDSIKTDSQVNEDEKRKYLDVKIDEITIYKDSVTFVISEDIDNEYRPYFSIRSFYLESNNWVTSGENTSLNIEEARQIIKDRAKMFFEEFKSIQNEFYRNN
jgi:hypothetical protein